MKMLLACREVAKLLAQDQGNHALALRMRLSLHLSICGPCTDYLKHLKKLKLEGKKYFETFNLDSFELKKLEDSILEQLKK